MTLQLACSLFGLKLVGAYLQAGFSGVPSASFCLIFCLSHVLPYFIGEV